MVGNEDIYEKLGSMSAKLDLVHDEVKEIKKTTESNKTIINRAIGSCVGISAFAGALCGGLGKAIAGLFH